MLAKSMVCPCRMEVTSHNISTKMEAMARPSKMEATLGLSRTEATASLLTTSKMGAKVRSSPDRPSLAPEGAVDSIEKLVYPHSMSLYLLFGPYVNTNLPQYLLTVLTFTTPDKIYSAFTLPPLTLCTTFLPLVPHHTPTHIRPSPAPTATCVNTFR